MVVGTTVVVGTTAVVGTTVVVGLTVAVGLGDGVVVTVQPQSAALRSRTDSMHANKRFMPFLLFCVAMIYHAVILFS